MKTSLKQEDQLLLLIVVLVALILGGLIQHFLAFKEAFIATLSIGVVVYIVLELYRRLGKSLEAQQKTLEQVYAYQKIVSSLQMTGWIPDMRGWAISPDIGWKYVCRIFEKKPDVIVECGSGVSTLLAGYALKQVGKGRVMALEHEKEFAELNQELLEKHGLNEYAQVVFAPLVKQLVNGNEYFWYELKNVDVESIDILFVDGPPAPVQKLSRYPALPLLHSKCRERFEVIMDDANRLDEKTIIERWSREFHLQAIKFRAEKGGYILSRKESRI